MSTNCEKWLNLGEKLGLTGVELRDFVVEQHTFEREERRLEREALKIQLEQEKTKR